MNHSMDDSTLPQACEEWAERLALAFGKDLSSTDREALEAHIQTCTACAAVYRDYSMLHQYLRRSVAVEALPGLPPELLEEMKLSRPVRRTPGSDFPGHLPTIWRKSALHLRNLLPVASVLLLMGIGTFLLKQSVVSALGANLADALAIVFAVGVGMAGMFQIQVNNAHRANERQMNALAALSLLPSPALESTGGTQGSWQDFSFSEQAPYPLSAPRKRRFKRVKLLMLLILLPLAVSTSLLSAWLRPIITTVKRIPFQPVTTIVNGIPLGISFGATVFDTDRPDIALKRQAAEDLAAGQSQQAERLWNQAVALDSSDAEALIYLENQRVLDSQHPHLTLVVTAIFAPGYLGGARDLLQGAYIAQKEYNDQARKSGSVQLYLLIAAFGFDQTSPAQVAQQIVQAAQQDPTIVGVMGWPTSKSAQASVGILAKAGIPMVSPTASSDFLTGISPDFFRIAPPDSQQGAVAARYAKDVLGAKQVVVFVDPQDSYSESLAAAFTRNFQDSDHSVVHEEYIEGDPGTLPQSPQEVQALHADLLYFAGFVNDATVLLKNLPTCSPPPGSCLQVMGGDALYVQGDYSLEAFQSYSRLIFTAFAFPDEWKVQHLSEAPPFFREYAQAFDPDGQYQPGKYGYNLPDADAMLAYDATQTLLSASTMLLSQGKTSFTSSDLRQALAHITGSNAIQGVSGRIAFGPDGNPIDKAVLLLAGTTNGQTIQIT